jgi:uncharacterized protein (TIRG00374 family)
LAAVLLYFAIRGVDWSGVWRTLSGARRDYIAAAAAIVCGSFFLRGLRWRILLKAGDARCGIGMVFWANMAGYLGNNFLPARAGELVRSFLVSRHSSLSKTYVLTTALAERLADVIALVLWSSLILMGLRPAPGWMAALSRSMAAVAAAGTVAIAVLPHTGGLISALLKRIPMPKALRRRLLAMTEQILLGLGAFHHWGRFFLFAMFTVTIWVADAASTMTGAAALGLHIPFSVAVLLLTCMGLGSALPSTPGYVGIYQFVAVTVLAPFGISRDGALAYILLIQAVGYTVVLAFGVAGIYRQGGSLRRLQAETKSEPAAIA